MPFESADYQTVSEDNNSKTTDMVGQDFLVQARQLSDSRSTTANNLPDLQIYDLSKDGGRTSQQGVEDRFPKVIECPGDPTGGARSSDVGGPQDSPFPKVIECPGDPTAGARSSDVGGPQNSPFPKVIECPGDPTAGARSSEAGASDADRPVLQRSPGPEVNNSEAGPNDHQSPQRSPGPEVNSQEPGPNDKPDSRRSPLPGVRHSKVGANGVGPYDNRVPGGTDRAPSTVPPLPGCGPWLPRPVDLEKTTSQ